MLIILILGNNNIRCLMPGAQWAQKQVISLSLDGILVCAFWQQVSTWQCLVCPGNSYNMAWVNSLGSMIKNATKTPISTPWKVIRISEDGAEGGGGGFQGLTVKGQCFEKKYKTVLEKLFLKGRGSHPLVLHISSAHAIH